MVLYKENRCTPFLIIIIFFLIYFYPYLFNGKVIVPFQLLANNPEIKHGAWIENIPKGQNGVGYDLLTQFYPWKEVIRRSYQGGYLPLWNSFNQAGAPFIANIQTGYFYPANVFLIFFNTPTAITLIAILNMFVAAFGTYFYLRIWGITRTFACLGAIGFVQSGYLVHWFQWIPHTGAMAWFPWVLAFIHLSIERWNLKWLLCAQISGAFAILSGHLQFAFYGFIAVVVYALIMVVSSPHEGSSILPKRLIKVIGILLVFFAGVGLLTACQLWPSWELTRHSFRGQENIYHLRETTFITAQILQLWSRSFLGAFDSTNGWGGYSLGLDNPYIPLFLSGVIISTIFSGFIFKRSMLPLLIVMVLSFGVVFGQKYLFILMGYVPLFDHFRAPSRFGFIGSFTVVCFSVLFISNIWQKLENDKKFNLPESFPYGITAITFVSLAMLIWWKYKFQAPHKHVLTQIFFVSAYLIIYQFIFYLSQIRKLLVMIPIILIVLGSVEAAITNFKFNPKIPQPESGILRLNPLLEKLGENYGIGGRLFRVSTEEFEPLFVPANLGLLHNISDMQGYDTFIRKEYAVFFDEIDNESFASIAKGWNQVRNLKPDELDSASLRLIGVKYILSHVPLKSYKSIGNVGTTKMYELPDSLPRLFLLPADMKTEILNSHREVLNQAKKLMGSYQIKIKKIPNGYEAELYYGSKAKVVLGELYYPGWRVWINGNEMPVNSIARGLIATDIEPGDHTLRFEYRPKNFFIAFKVSIISWVIVMVIFVYNGFIHRGLTKLILQMVQWSKNLSITHF